MIVFVVNVEKTGGGKEVVVVTLLEDAKSSEGG